MEAICSAVLSSRIVEIDARVGFLKKIELPKDPAKDPENTLSYIHAQIEQRILGNESTELQALNINSQGLRLADLIIAHSKNSVVENLARVNDNSSLDTINAWIEAFSGGN